MVAGYHGSGEAHPRPRYSLPVRVVFTNLWHEGSDPDAWIARDTLRRELARGLAALGHEVTVVQELGVAAERQDGPVRWIFVPPSAAARLSRAVLRGGGRTDARVKAPATHLLAPVSALRPEILHSFDLAFYPTLALLGRLAERQGAALIAHFHGGAPARTRLLKAVEADALGRTRRLLFTTRERGLQWVASGALADDRKIVEVFESSSVLTPGPAPRLAGAPALLHVGRLDPVKDPLTTIAGFRRLLARLPGAHLTLCWSDGPLEAEVRAACAGLPVTLLGRVPRDGMEALYRGADALVQASLREVCGYAALESLACGTPLLVSDIPPFRRLTDGGRLGRLFPTGQPAALAEAALDLWEARQMGQLGVSEVRGWFEEALAFPTLSRVVEEVYRTCLQEMRAIGKASP